MESPFDRPIAMNLIHVALVEHARVNSKPGFCGGSREMAVYDALKRAGYLTEEAQVPEPGMGRIKY